MVYVPDKRKRYKPVECKDQKTDYSRWIAEAWSQVLDSHFRSIRDPENALVGQDWSFGKLPAVMRIRVTTANVMEALRKRDPGAAKPYNFAISPILVQAPPDCTLIAPFSKHAKDWSLLPQTGCAAMSFLPDGGSVARRLLITSVAEASFRYIRNPTLRCRRCGLP